MNVLVTGGAGFIGSNVAEALVGAGHTVRVLDDLSTGFEENVPPGVELLEGSVADHELVRGAVEHIDMVFHFAAHRAVLRSVEKPLETDHANTHGTLTVLEAAREAGVRRVVFASSSSVYGGAAQRPTPESAPLLPRSPYAVTKLTGEHYCRVFTELYGLETVALRYFNVYGPRQRPDSAYAAVIPLFIDALREGSPVQIHGDGLQSRDFTFIGDVVRANLAASSAPAARCSGRVYNIAAGREHTLLDVLAVLERVVGRKAEAVHVGPRPGDVRHSNADITAGRRDLGFEPQVSLEDGLREAVAWFGSRSRVGLA
jgi:UDP-glucose 4-epimerase